MTVTRPINVINATKTVLMPMMAIMLPLVSEGSNVCFRRV